MNKYIVSCVSVLFSASLCAANPDTVDIASEQNAPLSNVQTTNVAIAPEPQTRPDTTSIHPTFAKEVTDDNGLAGNLFGGFRNAEATTADEGQKLESTKEASTSAVTDLTPMSLAQPMDQAQLEGLTVQQLRDLMQKMKISYRLIDSKEVLIRKILANKGY